MFNEQQELMDGIPSTAGEIDRDDATREGYRKPTVAWLLSDRDVWYANPYYVGAPQPHPEDQP